MKDRIIGILWGLLLLAIAYFVFAWLVFQWRNAGKPGLRLGRREKKKELIPK